VIEFSYAMRSDFNRSATAGARVGGIDAAGDLEGLSDGSHRHVVGHAWDRNEGPSDLRKSSFDVVDKIGSPIGPCSSYARLPVMPMRATSTLVPCRSLTASSLVHLIA